MQPSPLPCAPLGAGAPSASPRPRRTPPAPPSACSCREPAGSLSLPLPQRPPSQTQLCSSPELAWRRGAWAGRGKRGVRGRDREGGSPAHQPSFLSVHLAVGRERQRLQRVVHREADLGIADGRADAEDPPRAPRAMAERKQSGKAAEDEEVPAFFKNLGSGSPKPPSSPQRNAHTWAHSAHLPDRAVQTAPETPLQEADSLSSHPLGWLLFNQRRQQKQKTTSVGEDACVAGACEKMQPMWRTARRFLRKLNTEWPCGPATPRLGLHPKEVTTSIQGVSMGLLWVMLSERSCVQFGVDVRVSLSWVCTFEWNC